MAAERIKLSGAEIATYYSARVPELKQIGTGWWRGPCPIHHGHNGNFKVHPETGAWHCHSECGRGGSIIQLEMETQTDRGQIVDFAHPEKNDWLVVNQFTVTGTTASGSRERRPDVVVFLNGLPVAVFELKNAASETADVSAAYHQIQTYKDEIPELFRTNGMLVASDGIYARMGSLWTQLFWTRISDRGVRDGRFGNSLHSN